MSPSFLWHLVSPAIQFLGYPVLVPLTASPSCGSQWAALFCTVCWGSCSNRDSCWARSMTAWRRPCACDPNLTWWIGRSGCTRPSLTCPQRAGGSSGSCCRKRPIDARSHTWHLVIHFLVPLTQQVWHLSIDDVYSALPWTLSMLKLPTWILIAAINRQILEISRTVLRKKCGNAALTCL